MSAIATGSAVAATGHAVVVRELRRSFDGRTVLDGIDLTIAPGEFVALLGRSGSGKSTLLRALGELDGDYAGSALVPAQRSVVAGLAFVVRSARGGQLRAGSVARSLGCLA